MRLYYYLTKEQNIIRIKAPRRPSGWSNIAAGWIFEDKEFKQWSSSGERIKWKELKKIEYIGLTEIKK